jgi:hypothetical protein
MKSIVHMAGTLMVATSHFAAHWEIVFNRAGVNFLTEVTVT